MTVSAQETVDFVTDHMRNSRSDVADEGKPVFWLGAGCSAFDGVPLNAELLSRAVRDDPAAWGSTQFRFDRFCDSLGADDARVAYLTPYVKRSILPDSPYHALTRLLVAGYADVVFTFNIDDLLEQAFQEAGLRERLDYEVISVPEMQPDLVSRRIDPRHGPRLRIVKLHGDYKWGINYMTSTEITRYEPGIRRAVESWSQRPSVVCGYSFFHLNVLEAFSREGGFLVYANVAFPDAPMVLSLMASRNRFPWFADGDFGTFSGFTKALEQGLET
jgi:hypothetical protein